MTTGGLCTDGTSLLFYDLSREIKTNAGSIGIFDLRRITAIESFKNILEFRWRNTDSLILDFDHNIT